MGARLLTAAVAWRTCFGSDARQEAVDGIESAWLYGNMNRYAYYFADLLIGSPVPQRASVIVDTGSHLVGFPCKSCKHCGDHLDPAFDINQSKSARWLPCGGDCRACQHGHCSYSETYSEGSSISGFWFEDAVELGDSLQKNPPVRARLGCHINENRLFYTQRANGIMGLAPTYPGLGSPSSAPTFLQHLFRDKKHVDSAIFSLCLGTWGGKLTVGGYDSSSHIHNKMQVQRHCNRSAPCEVDGTTWISMHTSQYYFVFPQGVMLDGVLVATGAPAFGSTIIDSGTTYTYFPGIIYRALSAQLRTYCSVHDGCGADSVDGSSGAYDSGSECWRLRQPEQGLHLFPTIELVFADGVRVEWPARGYLHERGRPGTWCQTFIENNVDQTVLGISWMLHKDVIFDLSGGRLGVAQANCPEHRQQPDLGVEGKVSLDSTPASGYGVDDPHRSSLLPSAVGGLALLALPAAVAARLAVRAVAALQRRRRASDDLCSEEENPFIEHT